MQKEDYSEPEWIRGFFHGVLTCTSPRCAEITVVIGEMKVVDAYYEDPVSGGWDMRYETHYRLQFATPPLPVISVPDRAPDSVTTPLGDAFALVWASPGAALNALRRAVEAVLNEHGVDTTEETRRGPRPLNAHRRILLFKAQAAGRPEQEEAADTLLAVKWAGNEGSHAAVASSSTCLEAMDHIAHALRILYPVPDDNSDRIRRRVQEINQNKGTGRPVA